MDDDSMTFGSDAAGATPGSSSILAQPPLTAEDSPSGQDGPGGAALDSMCPRNTPEDV
jgi:SWI/SNF related-matrix-associated actin-dependent regulator of chromatin subfamily C